MKETKRLVNILLTLSKDFEKWVFAEIYAFFNNLFLSQ